MVSTAIRRPSSRRSSTTRISSFFYRSIIALIAIVAGAPIIVATLALFVDTGDIWQHLLVHVLPEALKNTAWLVAMVAILTAILGVSLAWLVSVYEFGGRRFFNWALLLPMAMPAYVMAFAYSSLFEFTGPVQTFWRDILGNPFDFPDIGARWASIATLSLVLYPYVFLIVRGAFASQGLRSLEVAQSCGLSPIRGFVRVSLPMARPFIIAGVALAVMESLADFGTVKTFNYTTFTTAIYQAWYGLFSLNAALQLSLVLIAIIFVALVLERYLRGEAMYTSSGTHAVRGRIRLSRRYAWFASGFCGAVLLVAFLVPAALIVQWSAATFTGEFDQRYWQFAANSLMLATLAATLITVVALILAYAVRRDDGRFAALQARIATLGYAIPGTVLAVGFFVPVAALSRAMNDYFGWHGGETIALQGGLLVILLAYLSRYLAVAHSPVESALSRIKPGIEEASRGLGVSGLGMLRKVHMPILSPALITAALLVFVDIMKELPITLMTRPFGWDTLAVRIFQLTTEGEWQRAALPAVAIVLVGLLPIYLLNRQNENA